MNRPDRSTGVTFFLMLFGALASNLGCSTLVQTQPASTAMSAWLDQHAGADAHVSLVESTGERQWKGTLAAFPGGDHPGLAFQATSGDRTLPFDQVREVTVVRRGRGAWEGALIGGLSGAAFGLVLGASDGNQNGFSCTLSCKAGERAGIEGVLFGGVGALFGGVAGALIGHRDIMKF